MSQMPIESATEASNPCRCEHWAETAAAPIRVKGQHIPSGSPTLPRGERRREEAAQGTSEISGGSPWQRVGGGVCGRSLKKLEPPGEGTGINSRRNLAPWSRQVDQHSRPQFFHLKNGGLFLQSGPTASCKSEPYPVDPGL